MRIARDWHVGRPTKAELVAGAIEGLLARIDPEAELYTRADLRRIPRFAPNGDGDVGLEVRREPPPRRQERPGYRVVSVRDGSPAALTGLKAGDLITHVDGRPAGEIAYLVMAHVQLPGPVGSQLRLTVERKGEDEPADVVLIRAATSAPAIAVDEVGPGIARVRLASIDGATASGLEPALSGLAALPTGSSRGVVIDLRSTAGGGPGEASAIGDAFLDSGGLLKIQARTAGPMRSMEAMPGDAAHGRPIIVLVDNGTAGAAEAIAAALRENHRARLVGTRTAGRGALRTLVPLGSRGEKGALRLTTERMLTPLGATFEGKGLTPDVVVEQSPASAKCRTLDIEDKLDPSRCVRRAASDDGQLARAIVLLDEALMAAKGAPGTPKP
jgi:carboxyl-terminal processing protease